jgi:hypothetical protein
VPLGVTPGRKGCQGRGQEWPSAAGIRLRTHFRELRPVPPRSLFSSAADSALAHLRVATARRGLGESLIDSFQNPLPKHRAFVKPPGSCDPLDTPGLAFGQIDPYRGAAGTHKHRIPDFLQVIPKIRKVVAVGSTPWKAICSTRSRGQTSSRISIRGILARSHSRCSFFAICLSSLGPPPAPVKA